MKQSFLVFLFSIAISASALAQKSQTFQTNGKAIRGFDAVAFHTEAKPVEGKPEYSYQWNDAAWFFSSQANLDSFKMAPQKYAPQYGGYCAYGTSDGHKAPTETDTWTIVDSKLYFNYNKKVKEQWSKKNGELIPKADKNWEVIKDKE